MTTATRTAIGNPRFYSTVSAIGDYTAHYRTERREARKINLTNLHAITEYAKFLRDAEPAEEANRQLWNLYHDLMNDAKNTINNSLRTYPPEARNPAELRTEIIADYSRAVIIAIATDDERKELII